MGIDVHRLRKMMRRDALIKHARLTRSGRPMVCVPSQLEKFDPSVRHERKGSDFKVIFDSERAALDCAEILQRCGTEPMRAYKCGRSRHGHYHLTTIRTTPANKV